ncbi:MAG: hypothetical protein ABI700_14290 [Chloroflexota bacterium]
MNRIAQQVADEVQKQSQVHSIQFVIWQRGITDPDTYVATGRIGRVGQCSPTSSLPHAKILDLSSQSSAQAKQTLKELFMQQISEEAR